MMVCRLVLKALATAETHLVFSQPPGIELELWLETERALPRRLIVIDHTLPGNPNYVAEMSDWNLSIHPADADFAFAPPDGARQIDFGVATGELRSEASP